jgi:hypothetical protein
MLLLSFYNICVFLFSLDDESLSEPLEETKASLVERFKKLFSHKYGKI